MRKIALSLVLCMLFGLCACSSQPEDLNKSSNPQEAETSQETESSGELTADSILGTWTLTGNRKQWRINSRFHIGHMDIGADYARRRRKHNPSNPSGE